MHMLYFPLPVTQFLPSCPLFSIPWHHLNSWRGLARWLRPWVLTLENLGLISGHTACLISSTFLNFSFIIFTLRIKFVSALEEYSSSCPSLWLHPPSFCALIQAASTQKLTPVYNFTFSLLWVPAAHLSAFLLFWSWVATVHEGNIFIIS